MRNTKMNTNEILNNWKNFTGYNNARDYSDDYDSNEYECFESEEKIQEFVDYYGYNFNMVYDILWHN